MTSLEDKRFLLVTGKGGVGKTTVAAAEALRLAGRGKRVLVAMCNAKERLSAMFGVGPVGAEVRPVAENVWAVNMDPERALEEYGLLTLKSRALYKVLFDNRYVRTFFRAVPGLHEWSMLGKAWWHTTETRDDGSWAYDVVILDAPATGHGLDMLRVPKIIQEVVPPGILRRDADRAVALFRDPAMTQVILVTLPEEMPTSETIELAASITGELQMPVGRVVVNGVLPPLFSRDERERLLAVTLSDQAQGSVREGAKAVATPLPAGEVGLAAAQVRAIRERVQAESLARLSRELPVEPSFLPLLFEEAATPKAIRELSRRL